MVELKEGAIKNVGPSNKEASVKLFDVERVRAREFGDKRVKFVFEDQGGNEVQVALFPEHVRKVEDDVEEMRDEGPVFE
jgi:hypothetical protein